MPLTNDQQKEFERINRLRALRGVPLMTNDEYVIFITDQERGGKRKTIKTKSRKLRRRKTRKHN
jgi:hypothetical protein